MQKNKELKIFRTGSLVLFHVWYPYAPTNNYSNPTHQRGGIILRRVLRFYVLGRRRKNWNVGGRSENYRLLKPRMTCTKFHENAKKKKK